ncbi:tRNA glutamyl-Q(34) synthetase GluQRS [Ketobacter sp.]|uniref:tRNA glutamyl-Q(34) synthetase GluQRS n=1 Tax=Ketobacter sp. TaxID=2083498 RepID=UPI000F0EF94E|nr:tRNA glutamyl-Q(34) synthetase GluQRS [Ketobacter sp.]RLT94733.1 MAG: tRNA glutamyl-Q(34) synthetase GluQRS [Ketobacter sp.]
MNPCYVGRFAPSPTGPLHIGSLLTAVASYLDAKAHQGQWLVRMEDLDPPREQPGAADAILNTLQHYGLHWDGDVLFQSQQHGRYETTVQQLLADNNAFYCTCSRTQILAASGSTTYPGTCRACHQPPATPFAVRLQVQNKDVSFEDDLQGPQRCNLQQQGGDFVIKRKEGLYAYHLAVVLDDALQGITHVVRGSDLLESTFSHWYLQEVLHLAHPHYAHLPVIVNGEGQKLSKQTYAEPIPRQDPGPYLRYCLQALGQTPPATLRGAAKATILEWGCEHWRLQQVPHQRSIPQQKL